MAGTKYTETDCRVCRALRDLLGATAADISRWTGIPPKSVKYLLDGRRAIPADNDDTRRALLRWWLLQRMPTQVRQVDGTVEQQQEIISRFNAVIADAEALNKERGNRQ